MQNIYVSMEEAAVLEGVGYKAISQRRARNPGKFDIRTEPGKNGGKERVLIGLNCLSRDAYEAYMDKVRNEVDCMEEELEEKLECECDDESIDGELDEETAWYVGVELAPYLEKYKDMYLKACGLAAEIEKFLAYDGKGKTLFTDEFASRLGMSSKTLRRKVDRYKEGKEAAEEMHELDGKNYDYYKVLALCKVPRERKGIVLNEEMKCVIENIWSNEKMQVNQQYQTAIYGEFLRIGAEYGWEKLPAYPTVNRYINQLKGKYGDVEHYLKFGDREFKRKKMLKRIRDMAKLKVMELVQGDGHTFDCWVKVTRENGTVNAIKPVLAGLIDSRSRCLVGWAICEVPNAQIIKQMVYHMIYPKKNSVVSGVPRVILIDNGKDWTAQTLTGRPRTERFDNDDDLKGFYRTVGIEYDKRSLPYQAWTKAQIERLFGTVCNQFTRTLGSYVGTLTGQRTDAKVRKDVKKMLDDGQLMDLEEFVKRWEDFLENIYHKARHSGLVDQKEKTPIPLEVFMNEERYMKAPPPPEFARMALLVTEERLVRTVGIRIFRKFYQHENLGPYIDSYVDVRYDPRDPDILFVYNKDGSKICEVAYEEGLHPLAEDGDERLVEHLKQQKRQMREMKQKVGNLRMTYAQRVALEEEAKRNEAKSAKDERRVILPELSGEAPAVVTLPDSERYRKEVAARKNDENRKINNKNSNKSNDNGIKDNENVAKSNTSSKKNSGSDMNEYMQRQADKAMARLAEIERLERLEMMG